MRVWLLTIALGAAACEERGRDIGKDPAHTTPNDPQRPAPSTSGSTAPAPSFSGRDPFKPPGDASDTQ